MNTKKRTLKESTDTIVADLKQRVAILEYLEENLCRAGRRAGLVLGALVAIGLTYLAIDHFWYLMGVGIDKHGDIVCNQINYGYTQQCAYQWRDSEGTRFFIVVITMVVIAALGMLSYALWQWFWDDKGLPHS